MIFVDYISIYNHIIIIIIETIMSPTTFNNVYMYNRVSTPKQADTGIPRQYEECKDGLQN